MSLWSKMKAGLKKVPHARKTGEPLSVSLLLESSRLFPGQILRGACQLTANKPIRIKDIIVSARGVETTHFQRQVGPSSNAHCQHTEINLNQSTPLMENGVTLGTKDTEPLSFNFELPTTAAPSFRGLDFKQSYGVAVRVSTFSGDDFTAETAFTVCTRAPDEEIPASVEQGDSNLKVRAKISSTHLNLDSTLGYNALCRSQLLEWGTVELLSVSEFQASVSRQKVDPGENSARILHPDRNGAETISIDVAEGELAVEGDLVPVRRVQRYVVSDSLGSGPPTSEMERLDVLQHPLPSGLLPTFQGKHVRHDTWIEFTLRGHCGDTVSVRQRLHLYTGANLDHEPNERYEQVSGSASSVHPNLYKG